MHQYITIVALSFIFLTACNRSTTSNTTEQIQTNSNSTALIGEWEYQQQICKDGKSYSGKFLLSIDNTTFTLEGNDVECNACFTNYTATDTNIRFEEGLACTEMECINPSEYCGPKTALTYLFSNLEYELKDETLLLKREGTSLLLTKKKAIQTSAEQLLGSWTYKQKICKDEETKIAEFGISFDGKGAHQGANDLECNTCYKGYRVEGNQLIYEAGLTCTRKACKIKWKACPEEGQAFSPFFNATFEIEGNTLTLKTGERSLVLTRG